MDDQRRAVRDAYDEIAAGYTAERQSSPAPAQSIVADLGEQLPDDAHVLDAGCGAGEPITTTLTDHVRVTAVDFSGEQLRLARDRAPEAAIVQGDITSLPLASNTFDALVSAYTIIHVPWDYQADCAHEFHRVCKAGAPVLLTVGTEDWAGENEDWLGLGTEMQWTMPGPERAISLLDEAGFSVQGQARYADAVGDEDGAMVVIQARA